MRAVDVIYAAADAAVEEGAWRFCQVEGAGEVAQTPFQTFSFNEDTTFYLYFGDFRQPNIALGENQSASSVSMLGRGKCGHGT